MTKTKVGDRVRVHYTGTLESGEEFDSSRNREPLEFVIGEGSVIPGFEEGVVDMAIGESKNISILPENGYGQRNHELVAEVMKSEIPGYIKPSPGMRLQIKTPDGGVMDVMVTEVGEDTVTLDGNHPLAGQNLLFDVELIEIL
jgi:peptidylprolyl isomerase